VLNAHHHLRVILLPNLLIVAVADREPLSWRTREGVYLLLLF